MEIRLIKPGILFFGLALAAGCSGAAASPDSAAPITPPVVSSGAVPTAAIPTASASPSAPVSAQPPVAAAQLEIQPRSSTVVAGQRLKLTIVNVSKRQFRFDHPGGTSGCDVAHWKLSARASGGQRFFDTSQAPGRLCTAVMTGPTSIVIEQGASQEIEIDTERGFVSERTMGLSPSVELIGPTRLAPGEYEVSVSGGDVTVSTRVTVTKS